MQKVKSNLKYDFYIGTDNKGNYYNIVPKGSTAPTSGYYDKNYIEQLKGFEF